MDEKFAKLAKLGVLIKYDQIPFNLYMKKMKKIHSDAEKKNENPASWLGDPDRMPTGDVSDDSSWIGGVVFFGYR